MSDYNDPLYRETIPTRPTPPPDTLDGPTAHWNTYLAEQAAVSLSCADGEHPSCHGWTVIANRAATCRCGCHATEEAA